MSHRDGKTRSDRRPAWCTLAAVVLSLWFTGAFGYGYGRNVVVNGVPMSAQQLQYLDQVQGELIPNGRYWLDTSTGLWGYEGGSAQGILGRPDVNLSGQSSGRTTGNRFIEDDFDDFCARYGC